MRTPPPRGFWLATILTVSLSLASHGRAGDPLLYGTTETGNFGKLDLLTGVFSPINTGTNASAGIQVIESIGGIGFSTNGNLYGFTYASETYLINTNSGVVTFVGSTPPLPTVESFGMTATPGGAFYAYLSPGGNSNSLYSLDPTTGALTLIGGIGSFLDGGLTSDQSGNLYLTAGTTPDKLYSVNPSTGTATLIGVTGSSQSFAVGFLGATLYLVDYDGTIWSANTATGAATQISTYNNQYGFMLSLASMYSIPATAPAIQSVSQAGGAITLTWTAVAGRSYQVQSSPDLGAGHWVNIGSPVNATGIAPSASDSVRANSRRFYRVVLLPQ